MKVGQRKQWLWVQLLYFDKIALAALAARKYQVRKIGGHKKKSLKVHGQWVFLYYKYSAFHKQFFCSCVSRAKIIGGKRSDCRYEEEKRKD